MRRRGRPFKKGRTKTGGRRKGTPNRVTLDQLRQAVLDAAHGAGGRAGVPGYLVSCAKRNRNAFLGLFAKLLPKEILQTGEVVHTIRDFTGHGPHQQLVRRLPNGELVEETVQ